MSRSLNDSSRVRIPWERPTVTAVRHRSTLTDLGWWVVAFAVACAFWAVLLVCYLIGSR